LENIGRGASKTVLAQWVSLALQRALTESNIRNGFRATGIWPLNKDAINHHMLPSARFIQANPGNIDNGQSEDDEGDNSTMEEDDQFNNEHAEERRSGIQICDSQAILPNQPVREQYFIGSYEPQLQSNSRRMASGSNNGSETQTHGNALQPSIHSFMQLPQVVVQRRPRRTREEPLVDYRKSIMLTSEQYLQNMELKAERKEKAKREAKARKLEAEKRKDTRAAEKLQKEAEKAQREVDAHSREAFKQKWSPDAIHQAGEQLQWLIKNAPLPLPGAYQAPFCGILPQICKENMARRLAKRRATKYGIGSMQDVPPSTAPTWVHCCDPIYMAEGMGGNSEDAPPLCYTAGASATAPVGTEQLSGPQDSLQ
jgi:hypothetical protein